MEWVSSNKPRTRGLYYEFLGFAPRKSVRFWVFIVIIAITLISLLSLSSSISAPSFKLPTFESTCSAKHDSNRYYGGEFTGQIDESRHLEKIQHMVAKTKGYYVRDRPLQLGWNNIRYIIEAAALHASLLNRTLVIPSFIYARTCVYDMDVCSAFAQRFHRGEEIGLGDFAFLSEEEQIAWRLPISLMIDMTRLRTQNSIVTVAEYLRIHHLDTSIELGNGTWDRWGYHDGLYPSSLRSLEQSEWDENFLRVDKIPTGMEPMEGEDKIRQALLERGQRFSVGDAQSIMSQNGEQWIDDAEFIRMLNKHGYSKIYSFRTSFVEMFKAVTEWEDEVADVQYMKGLVDQLGPENADVVHIQGETHWNRKAGQLYFTSPEGRQNFASMVLHGVHPIPSVRALGDHLSLKMVDLNGGRQYLSAHMRRGDFAVLGWAEPTIEDHIRRILNRLSIGMGRLAEYSSKPPHVVDVPGIEPDEFFAANPRPRAKDKFFLATDVRNKTDIATLRERGAVLLDELVHPEDLRIVGWPMMFGDVRAQVEQEIATHAAFFYGHSMSSVAGGVANLRAARGQDPRTCYVD